MCNSLVHLADITDFRAARKLIWIWSLKLVNTLAFEKDADELLLLSQT